MQRRKYDTHNNATNHRPVWFHPVADPGDVVIDPCFGSGSTARACMEAGRSFYGFEISKQFFERAKGEMCNPAYIDDKKEIKGQTNIFDFLGGSK